MRRNLQSLGVLIVMLGLLSSVGYAAGGSRVETPPIAAPPDPIQQANQHYNTGLRYRDRAWKLEIKAANSATPEEKRQKLQQKARKSYERAAGEFTAATNKNPGFYQAYSSLGYALRKLGGYRESLLAYDRALDLQPDYGEAIEYRAEAFLGLDQIEDAKEAYITLFGQDRKLADELMQAMRRWVEDRRSESQGLDNEFIEEFARWVQEREEIAQQTASLTGRPADGTW